MPTITSTPTSGSSAMPITTVTSAGSSKSTTASMTSSSITPTTTSATNSSPMPTTSTTATGSSSTAASSTSIITGSTIDSSIAIQIFNSEPSLIENLKALTKDERDLFLTKAVESFQGSIVQGEKLGAGNFGEVISCNVDDTKFAVKKFRQTELSEAIEVKLLLEFKHENIISGKFLCLLDDHQFFCLGMEFMNKTSLYNFMATRKSLLSKEKVNFICEGLAKGLEYIHQQNVIHRDVKPENILLSSNNEVKLADFGLAEDRRKQDPIFGIVGTLPYVPPELWEGTNPHNEKVDIWAFGVVFCELLSGIENAPFTFMNHKKNRQNLSSLKNAIRNIRLHSVFEKFAFPTTSFLKISYNKQSYQLSEEEHNLARICLSKSSEDRPSASKLKDIFQELPQEWIFQNFE
jgi:serine/threonine protein kinase